MKPQVLAKELANSIRESPEYQAWEKAKAEVDKHEVLKSCWRISVRNNGN